MEKPQENKIDIFRLFFSLLKKWWIILLAALLCGGLAFGYTTNFVTPQYTANALMYVNSSISVGGGSLQITAGELSVAKTLVDTYCIILKARLTLEEVIKVADLNYTYEQLSGMVSAEAVNETEIFRITVRSKDPEEACKIANAITDVLPEKIEEIVAGSSVRTVDMAVVPTAPSSPSVRRNTILGMFAGIVVSCAAIIFFRILDDTIDSVDDVIEEYGDSIPLLAVIPDINAKSGKSKYYYYYGHRKKKDAPTGGEEGVE
ncbi:MAG: YveK family protein [Eubacteriales bacterium]